MLMNEICPLTESIKVVGTTPRLLIVRYLDGNGVKKSSLGFNELKKLSKLSSRTLALNLKFLMNKKVIEVKVEKNRKYYSLTAMGEEMVPILHKIGDWGNKWDIYK